MAPITHGIIPIGRGNKTKCIKVVSIVAHSRVSANCFTNKWARGGWHKVRLLLLCFTHPQQYLDTCMFYGSSVRLDRQGREADYSAIIEITKSKCLIPSTDGDWCKTFAGLEMQRGKHRNDCHVQAVIFENLSR